MSWSFSARPGSWHPPRSSALPKGAAPSYLGRVANPGNELYGGRRNSRYGGGAGRWSSGWKGPGPWVPPRLEAPGPAPRTAIS